MSMKLRKFCNHKLQKIFGSIVIVLITISSIDAYNAKSWILHIFTTTRLAAHLRRPNLKY